MLIGIASKRAPVARFVSTAANAVSNGLYSLTRRTQQRRIQNRYSFEQGSRRFGQTGHRLTNSLVNCLPTTQARKGAQPWKGTSRAEFSHHDETQNAQ